MTKPLITAAAAQALVHEQEDKRRALRAELHQLGRSDLIARYGTSPAQRIRALKQTAPEAEYIAAILDAELPMERLLGQWYRARLRELAEQA